MQRNDGVAGTQAPRLLTLEEVVDVAASLTLKREVVDAGFATAIQRKFMEVNGIAVLGVFVCQACAGDAPSGKCQTPKCVGGPIVEEIPDGVMGTKEPGRQLLERAYEDGWCAAAHWAKREDLEADIGSPAYIADRDGALDALGVAPSQPEPEAYAGPVTWTPEDEARLDAAIAKRNAARATRGVALPLKGEQHE